jgi:hypothetical protein
MCGRNIRAVIASEGRRPERSNLCVCIFNGSKEIASVVLLPRNDEMVVSFLGAKQSQNMRERLIRRSGLRPCAPRNDNSGVQPFRAVNRLALDGEEHVAYDNSHEEETA